jgi:UDP-perosamine 4-acetyltransferase
VTDRESVLVVGAGDHAKVVIELIAEAAQYRVVGLVDNIKSGPVLGIPVVGTDDDLPSLRGSGIARAFVAIGDNERRLATGHHLQTQGFQIVNVISPAANISPTVQLGLGIAIMAGAVVNAQCRIEDFVIINTGAIIDHDSQIGEGSHVAPGCALAGRVKLGRLAFLGTGTSAIPGISVGDCAIVGAGACVVRNVPAGALAVGVPARVVRRHDHRVRDPGRAKS